MMESAFSSDKAVQVHQASNSSERLSSYSSLDTADLHLRTHTPL